MVRGQRALAIIKEKEGCEKSCWNCCLKINPEQFGKRREPVASEEDLSESFLGSHRQGRASQAVMWVECRVLEAGCGGRRRSLLSTVMRIPCSFWFLLLLGAGSLLLLHLQDLTETLQQQNQEPSKQLILSVSISRHGKLLAEHGSS
ncbi:unnamed protein product [Leuciscus chuanchicus]